MALIGASNYRQDFFAELNDDISDKYFDSRPIGSRLGAIASNQSQVIVNRNILEQKLDDLKKIYKVKSKEFNIKLGRLQNRNFLF